MTRYFLISLLLVLIFFIIAKMTVYDKYNLMPKEMFTSHYMLKFYFLLFIGLMVASVFFGGYLVMGDIMKQCTLKTAELSDDTTKNANAIAAICIVYDAANINFKKYFLTTALSLTGVVIVTGILFSAINNLDFSKLYYTSFKKPFVSYDIVYLFGGLYSLLILLFYLPLRLSFSDLKEKHPEVISNPVPPGTPFYKSKDFWNRLKESFTVSTPLLAGLVQLIIEIFTR